jgi:sorbitol/mannitol transport system permease protein
MAKAARRRSVSVGILAWVIAIILFPPILWMILTSFKTELDAVEFPPSFIFEPTLENFGIVQERSNYLKYAANSTVLSFGSTFLGILIGVPAAWAHGLPSRSSYQIYHAVNAFDKDDACCRCTAPYLPDFL